MAPIDDDPNPKMTAALKREYTKEILGGITPTFSVEDENKFIYASVRIKKFFDKNGDKLMSYLKLTESRMADLAISAIKANVGEENMFKVHRVGSHRTTW